MQWPAVATVCGTSCTQAPHLTRQIVSLLNEAYLSDKRAFVYSKERFDKMMAAPPTNGGVTMEEQMIFLGLRTYMPEEVQSSCACALTVAPQ